MSTLDLTIAGPALIPDRNVFEIAAGRVRPGYVLINGLVLDVDDLVFHFAHNAVEIADSPGQPVTVLGRVSAEILAAARNASPNQSFRRTQAVAWDEDECPDCACCTRDQCKNKTCSGRCPCSTG